MDKLLLMLFVMVAISACNFSNESTESRILKTPDSSSNLPQGIGGICPSDAKLCPNGTSVSRSGANCTFEACP